MKISDRVLLSDGTRFELVHLREIRYFETYGNYSKAYFNDKMMLINRTLNYLEEKLPDSRFFRANRQFIINLSHIKDVKMDKSSSFELQLECGKIIEISRRRSQTFKELLTL